MPDKPNMPPKLIAERSVPRHPGNPAELRLPIVAVVVVLISLFAFYPGFMSADSSSQLLQARNNYYFDWHPAAMAYVWRWLDLIHPGPLLMLLLQLSLLWLGCIMLFAGNPIVSSNLAYIFIPSCLFIPPVFGNLGVIGKDNLMAGSLLLGFSLMQRISTRNKKSGTPKFGPVPFSLHIVLLLFCCLFALMLRHNSIAAVYSLIWYVSFVLLPWPRRLIARLFATAMTAVPVALSLFLIGHGLNSLIVDKKTQGWRSVAIFDIAGVAVKRGRLHFDGETKSSGLGGLAKVPAFTVDDLTKNYTPRNWGNLTRTLFKWGDGTKEELAALSQLWRQTIVGFPLSYLSHRWAVFSELVGITPNHPRVPVFFFTLSPELAKKTKVNYQLSDLQNWLSVTLNDLAKNSILYRPYLFLVIGLFTAACGLFVLRKDMGLVFFFSFSGLGHEALLFIAAPGADFRFSHWMIISVWGSLLLLIGYAAAWRHLFIPSSDVLSLSFWVRRFGAVFRRLSKTRVFANGPRKRLD
ncbi:MAG: hypothetical protein O2967_09180 [Proteobacteria bacterium]|nr:hypothetical protein [Pseudomonadota bacterium]